MSAAKKLIEALKEDMEGSQPKAHHRERPGEISPLEICCCSSKPPSAGKKTRPSAYLLV